MSEVFRIDRPERQDTAVIFASPHSGRAYSPAFLAQTVLRNDQIRSSEDAFVDQLFADAPLHGAPLLAAQVPRAYLDLNRAPDELDPAVIEGVSRAPHNPRVSSGLGVIPRVVAGGRPIYRGKLSLAEAEKRNDTTTAIVRVEQLYPTPVDEIKATYAQYPNAELFWVQDEPANQGPWTYIGLFLPKYMNGQVATLVSRPASASPATGSAKTHAAEQADLIARAFAR